MITQQINLFNEKKNVDKNRNMGIIGMIDRIAGGEYAENKKH